MGSRSLVRVSTKKKVTPKAPTSSIDVQYPIDWFNFHPDSKPILNITLVCPDLEKSGKVLAKGIKDNAIDLDVANTFLFHFAKTIKSRLDGDWTSYGRLIGSMNDEISPLDLLTVNEISRADRSGINTSANDYPWMAGYVLSIYRLVRAGMNTYRTELATRITSQLRAICKNAGEVSDIVDIYSSWPDNRTYNTLVAVFDMYFNRFPLHPYAGIRIVTTGSRFRDCAALLSYGYIMELLGMPKTTDVMDWVFIEHIGNNIDRMMGSEDEIEDSQSYFPYQVDMGLVMKSAFSATANPYFFEWIHLICALARSSRSINAKHINDGQSLAILANAACVAYAYISSFTFQKVYTEDGTAIEMTQDGDDDDEESDDEDLSDTILKTRDPTKWCILLSSRKGMLPKPVIKYVQKVAKGIVEPRAGTIDEHLKTIAAGLDNA